MCARVVWTGLVVCLVGLGACRRDRAADWQALVEQAGSPEIPRYIKYHELDPQDQLRVLRPPDLQRGRPGRPIVLRRDQTYLYSVAEDGTFLVAAKAPFGSVSSCGHPNLTGGRAARISGELKYDPAAGRFVLNNDSGRYGFQFTRHPGQLEAARRLLAAVGCRLTDGRPVQLATKWIEPWRDAKYRLWDRIRPFLKEAPAHFDVAGWREAFVRLMKFRRPAVSAAALHGATAAMVK